MSQLKSSFIVEVKQALENSIFTLGDFEINLPEGSTLINIQFSYVDEYKMSVNETTKRREKVTSSGFIALGEKTTEHITVSGVEIRMSPGKYKSTDIEQVYEIGDLLEHIPKWCSYIKKDLHAKTPQVDLLEEMRKEYVAEAAKLYDNPESFFEEEEASAVDEKFENLYKKIESIQEEHSITQSELEKVKRDFEGFKENARAYPKGMWAKTTVNKLISIFDGLIKTKEGRAIIFDQIKKLIQNQ